MAAATLNKILEGHTRSVNSVAFSTDSKLLASASRDCTVRLWNIPNGDLNAELKGHTSHAWSVAFSPDGRSIVTGSGDKTVRIWSVATKQQPKTLKGHFHWVNSVAWSPNGNVIASGSYKTVILWDAISGSAKKKLTGHKDYVWSVSFSQNGNKLASAGGLDNTAIIWDVRSGAALIKLAHSSTVYSICFSHDNQFVVTGCRDNIVRMFNANTGREEKRFEGHTKAVLSVACSFDGSTIASGSDDKSVRLWDVASTKQLQQLDGHTDQVYSVAFSRDGKFIASGSNDTTVRLWNAPSSSLQPPIKPGFTLQRTAEAAPSTRDSRSRRIVLLDPPQQTELSLVDKMRILDPGPQTAVPKAPPSNRDNQIRAEKSEQELIKLKQMLEAEKQKQLEKSTNAQRAQAKQLEVEALRQELEKVREKEALEKELRHLKEKKLQQENLALREQLKQEKERVKAEMRAAELNKIKQTLHDTILQKEKQELRKQIADAKRQEEIELREQRVRDLQIQTKELDLQAKRNQMQHQLDGAARKASSTHEAEIQALQEQLKVAEARANDFKALKAQIAALDVKLDLEAPDWNAATWSDGSWQSFEMIEFRLSTTDQSEIAKATVVEQSKTMIELRVKAQPFAKGGFRFAHYAQRRDMQRFVLKKLQSSMVSDSSLADALNEIKLVVRIQLLALHCAQSFQNKLEKLVNGKYINIYAVQAMPSGSKVEYWTIEPLLPAKFEKFNGNDGSCELNHEEPQALSHFSYGFFQEKMVLVDVQGCKEGTQYTYTDPAFHSTTDSFGDSDCGMNGIVKFFTSHVCNSKCKALGLLPHEAQKK